MNWGLYDFTNATLHKMYLPHGKNSVRVTGVHVCSNDIDQDFVECTVVYPPPGKLLTPNWPQGETSTSCYCPDEQCPEGLTCYIEPVPIGWWILAFSVSAVLVFWYLRLGIRLWKQNSCSCQRKGGALATKTKCDYRRIYFYITKQVFSLKKLNGCIKDSNKACSKSVSILRPWRNQMVIHRSAP